jgi:GNAT superfamily N-acetyltransferase
MLIRRIRADDAMRWRELRLRALRTDPLSFGSIYEREVGRDDGWWLERAQNGAESHDWALFLAVEEEQFVGLAATRRDEQRPLVFGVYSLWVAPEVRCRNLGVELVKTLEGWAADHGATSLELMVTTAALSARRLYEKCGFVLDERTEPSPHPGVVELGMVKRLGATY